MTYPRVVVDLGSNTFHWVIASGVAVETFERRGLRVALAAGLSAEGELAPEALRRAEAALAHVNKDKSESAYARSDVFEKRRMMMESWASYLTAQTSEVVALEMRQ